MKLGGAAVKLGDDAVNAGCPVEPPERADDGDRKGTMNVPDDVVGRENARPPNNDDGS